MIRETSRDFGWLVCTVCTVCVERASPGRFAILDTLRCGLQGHFRSSRESFSLCSLDLPRRFWLETGLCALGISTGYSSCANIYLQASNCPHEHFRPSKQNGEYAGETPMHMLSPQSDMQTPALRGRLFQFLCLVHSYSEKSRFCCKVLRGISSSLMGSTSALVLQVGNGQS